MREYIKEIKSLNVFLYLNRQRPIKNSASFKKANTQNC